MTPTPEQLNKFQDLATKDPLIYSFYKMWERERFHIIDILLGCMEKMLERYLRLSDEYKQYASLHISPAMLDWLSRGYEK